MATKKPIIAYVLCHDPDIRNLKRPGLGQRIARSPRLWGTYDAIRFWGYINPYREGTPQHAEYLAAWKESTRQEHEELRNNPHHLEARKPSPALGSHGSVCHD